MQYEIGISRYGDNKKNVCGSAFIIFNENMKVENIRILRRKRVCRQVNIANLF